MALVELSYCHKCNKSANEFNGVLLCVKCRKDKYDNELGLFLAKQRKLTLEKRIELIEKSMFDNIFYKINAR